MMKLKTQAIIGLFVLWFLPILAQRNIPEQISDQARFTLVTGSPGYEAYNMYGHSAIRLIDPYHKIDWVFNYGTFNFDEPGFVLKFVQRKLLYKLSISSYRGLRLAYEHEARGMANQTMNLNAAQRQALYQFLRANYLDENKRYYLYDFYYDNCSTRIRDALYSILKGNLNHQELVNQKTFRNHLKPYMTNKNWMEYGIDLGIGMNSDKLCDFDEEMFLPDLLARNLANIEVDGQPLLGEMVWDLPRPEAEKPIFSLIAPFPILGIISIIFILSSIAFQSKRKLQNGLDGLLFLVLGLAGAFLLFLWFGTDHIATQYNLNILWLNPLYLAYFVLLLFKRPKKWFSYLLLLLMLTNGFSLLQFIFYIQQIHWANFLLIIMMGIRMYYRWHWQQKQLTPEQL